MITAIRPYTPQHRQQQNFGATLEKEFIVACDTDPTRFNRIMSFIGGTRKCDYTEIENKPIIEPIIRRQQAAGKEISPTLQKICKRLNIKL